ncbi:hypothetical protein ACLQ24_00195 [Micromonospora sp. DT4]|uniref:hypothetical protein n=1 Tax=Micromonospora sp. DT4 TaxID=3393438 RepID=UPI003CF73036
MTSDTAALVAIDVFLGPYPARVTTPAAARTLLVPRFRLKVARRLADATAALAAGTGRVVTVTGNRVAVAELRDGHLLNEELIAAGPDGRYPVPAPLGQWSLVETGWDRDGDCECGTCTCPPVCAVCAQPVDGGHAPTCVWPAGSAAWERPAIAPAAVVLDVHRHRPGCVFVRRRPGPLFSGVRQGCAFCGEPGARSSHTLTRADGSVEHHQRCRACLQIWQATN